MANEYLQRTPTSTGNQRVWTWSGWVKRNSLSDSQHNLWRIESGSSGDSGFRFDAGAPLDGLRFYLNGTSNGDLQESAKRRDLGSWIHVMAVYDSTNITSSSRVQLYINGARIRSFSTETYPTLNYIASWNGLSTHKIGASTSEFSKQQFTDIFFVDGQALTPDVFGFNKPGKGYISVGSTQATDFRPGQWVPKTPRVIKTEINRRGGFGVNGFYLPMNDSNNFGADFHGTPNSIIKLQENLPQPRCRIDGVGDYTGALRDDPFKQYLVLALPFVSGGLSSGFGDYAPSIKGSGSAKTITNNTSVSIANTHGYYGSSVYIDSVNYLSSSSADFAMGTGDFTVEGWINQTGGDTTYGGMFSTATSDSSGTGIVIARDQCWLGSNAVAVSVSAPGGTFWPLNQWTHIAFVRKTNTLTVFVNGVAAGITTNVTSNVGKTDAAIGRRYYNNSSFTPIAYIQDLRIYKGVAKYTGGFDVPKPYTPVGIATWRAVPDTTANNFATWNPLDRARNTGTQTDGNLATGTNSGNYAIRSTVGVSTGKWYWEFLITAASTTNHHGIVAVGRSMGAFYLGETLDSWGMYDANGNKRNNGSFESYGTGFSQYDVGMVALDRTNGKIWWGRNGTWFASGDPSAGSNAGFSNINSVCGVGATDSFVSPSQLQYSSCSYNFGQNPTFSGNTTAGTFTDSNGKGLFKYQPPSGFLALCEDNLPTPAISDPGKYFKTVLWTGDGNTSSSIVGVGFTPDLVWIKDRSVAYNHILVDSLRGATFNLHSNNTNTEATATTDGVTYGTVSSFGDNSFSVLKGSTGAWTNQSNENYVAWCWRAGAGTTSTNTNGSITSVVSVNQDAGFSIVSWTGAGSGTSTVGHGLGKQPAFIITKARDSALDNNWVALHKSSGTSVFSHYLYLNSTAAANPLSPTWPATSTIFTTTPGFNSAARYISYCWAEIEGFSKAFSYVGNGSADGPFTFLSMKPAFVIIKRTDSTGNWCIHDSSRGPINVMNEQLQANLANIESGTGGLIDFLSNGFKIRSTSTDLNASGGTYIGMAFAESPFTTANAK